MSSLIPLLAVLSIAGWPARPAPPSADAGPPVGIALAVDDRLPAAVARAAVEEAAAIWAPYDVSIVRLDLSRPPGAGYSLGPCGSADGLVGAGLTVRLADPVPATSRAWSSPFGSIRFLPDGEPEPTILLHYDAILRVGLSTVTVGGSREWQWPKALRDRILARMIGRVLAHEVGHWLLRSREHSAGGLMRAYQPANELAEPGRERFILTAADIARLRAQRTYR